MFGTQKVASAVVLLSTVDLSATASAAPTNPGELVNDLASSSDCNYCHAFANQDNLFSAPPYAPQANWTPTMMANSAKDPVFWAAVALASQDDPEHTEDCIRCHSPNAFLQGRGGAISIDELDAYAGDLEGVTCELCHRMTSGSVIGNAQYEIDDVLQAGTVVRRGPFDYTDGVPQPVPGTEGHSTAFDPYTGSAELCGACHDVTTARERVDVDGNGMGTPFNEQRTYSEWARSAFAQPGDGFRSCRDCHMPEVPDTAACGPYNNVYQHPVGNRRHDLLGANRFMLTLLQEDAAPGFEASTYGIALERMDEFLATSATMEVEPPASVDLGAGLEGLTVTITNETGHKLPSGYSEGRVMWIEVVGRYGGEVVMSSGLWDQATATIQDDPAVRRYEGIAQDYDSGVRNHLLLNNHWAEDSRIPPRGLRPDVETDPVGGRYPMLGDGTWQHWDEVSYGLPGAPEVEDATPSDPSDDTLEVSVRLLYVINTREYIELLANDNETNEAGTEIASRFEAMGWATPVVLAEQEISIPIASFGGGSGSSSTSDGGGEESTAASTPTTDPTTAADPTGDTASASSSDTDAPSQGGGGGGGCRVGGEDGAAWGLGLLMLGFVRRRQRR